MMTGKDLIMYILLNDLEDAPIFEDGKFIGFITEEEAAVKFGVGTATIRVWINQEKLDGFRINDAVYISANATNPMDKE